MKNGVKKALKRRNVETHQRPSLDQAALLPQGTPFEQFKQRLQTNCSLSSVPSEMTKICDAADVKLINQKVLAFINHNQRTVSQLKPGEALRFDKRRYALPFNAQITCSINGKLRLFIETNTKLKDGTKDLKSALVGSGTFKKVLKCYRIDTPVPVTWACAKIDQSKHDEPGVINDTLKEAILMNSLDHPHIAKTEPGCRYKAGKKIVLYSKMALGTLQDVIDGKIEVSIDEKQILMMQAFDAVAYLHANGVVHQDLKPLNILIYRKKDGGLIARVNDFGLSYTRDNEEEPGGTIGYESPETSAYHNNPNAVLFNYFHRNTKPSLAKDLLTKTPFVPKVITEPQAIGDSWSMGIMYYEVLHGKKPDYRIMSRRQKTGNSIINALLESDVDNRLSCDDAFKQLSQKHAPVDDGEKLTARKRKLGK